MGNRKSQTLTFSTPPPNDANEDQTATKADEFEDRTIGTGEDSTIWSKTCFKATNNSFLLTGLQVTIRRKTQTNHVSLKNVKFRFEIPEQFTHSRCICPISSETYLMTDITEKRVLKWDTLSGVLCSVQLKGPPYCLCEINEYMAAVMTRSDPVGFCVDILTTIQKMRISNSFQILRGKCKELIYISYKLYAVFADGIIACSLNGSIQRMVFSQRDGNEIITATKGPNDTIIFLSEINGKWVFNVLYSYGFTSNPFFVDIEYCPKPCTRLTADLNGTAYICCKDHDGLTVRVSMTSDRITAIGIIPSISGNVNAMCFSEKQNMLVLLLDKFIILDSVDTQ